MPDKLENFDSEPMNIESLRKKITVIICTAVLMIACSLSTWSGSSATPTETSETSATPAIVEATSTPQPPSITPTPTLGIGSTLTRDSDGAVMVYVPAGEFLMGSNDAGADEKPEHMVYLIDYWIDKTEVTNGMYENCFKDGACREAGSSSASSKYDDFPVSDIRWPDAQSYCAWAGARLPTEAEWEKAARGTDGRTYPWGEELDPTKYYLDVVPTGGSSRVPHRAVGSFPDGASPYGALDMSGSLFEWVSDVYSATYYEDSPYSNPIGPSNDGRHFYRGGNFVDYDLRVFSRSLPPSTNDPEYVQYGSVGFRCVMETAP